MAQTYTIQGGDHTSGIAARFGFADFHTIWDHPQNAALKKKRSDPHVLMPGDALFVPDKEPKTVERPTGRVHTFQVKQQRLFLKLAVRDFDDQAVANTDCVLEVDGTVYNLQTDGKGRIDKEIPRNAQGGTLKIPSLGYEFPVKIGYLDPVDEETGWRARLINLGYHAGPLDAPDKLLLQYAIEEFQCDYKLRVTGVLDAGTRAKLKEVHGG
jgi:hypothetical protein